MHIFGWNFPLLFIFLVTIKSQQPLHFLYRILPEDAIKAVPFTFPSADVTSEELPSITTILPPISTVTLPDISTQTPGPSTAVIPEQNEGAVTDIVLQDNDCSLVLDIRDEGRSIYRFALGPSNGSRCILTLHGPSRLALQVSDVRLAPGEFQCEAEEVAVFTLADGCLFFMNQFCGSRSASPLLLTDSPSAIVTVRYGGGDRINSSGSFNLHVFTYEPYGANIIQRPSNFYW